MPKYSASTYLPLKFTKSTTRRGNVRRRGSGGIIATRVGRGGGGLEEGDRSGGGVRGGRRSRKRRRIGGETVVVEDVDEEEDDDDDDDEDDDEEEEEEADSGIGSSSSVRGDERSSSRENRRITKETRSNANLANRRNRNLHLNLEVGEDKARKTRRASFTRVLSPIQNGTAVAASSSSSSSANALESLFPNSLFVSEEKTVGRGGRKGKAWENGSVEGGLTLKTTRGLHRGKTNNVPLLVRRKVSERPIIEVVVPIRSSSFKYNNKNNNEDEDEDEDSGGGRRTERIDREPLAREDKNAGDAVGKMAKRITGNGGERISGSGRERDRATAGVGAGNGNGNGAGGGRGKRAGGTGRGRGRGRGRGGGDSSAPVSSTSSAGERTEESEDESVREEEEEEEEEVEVVEKDVRGSRRGGVKRKRSGGRNGHVRGGKRREASGGRDRDVSDLDVAEEEETQGMDVDSVAEGEEEDGKDDSEPEVEDIDAEGRNEGEEEEEREDAFYLFDAVPWQLHRLRKEKLVWLAEVLDNEEETEGDETDFTEFKKDDLVNYILAKRPEEIDEVEGKGASSDSDVDCEGGGEGDETIVYDSRSAADGPPRRGNRKSTSGCSSESRGLTAKRRSARVPTPTSTRRSQSWSRSGSAGTSGSRSRSYSSEDAGEGDEEEEAMDEDGPSPKKRRKVSGLASRAANGDVTHGTGIQRITRRGRSRKQEDEEDFEQQLSHTSSEAEQPSEEPPLPAPRNRRRAMKHQRSLSLPSLSNLALDDHDDDQHPTSSHRSSGPNGIGRGLPSAVRQRQMRTRSAIETNAVRTRSRSKSFSEATSGGMEGATGDFVRTRRVTRSVSGSQADGSEGGGGRRTRRRGGSRKVTFDSVAADSEGEDDGEEEEEESDPAAVQGLVFSPIAHRTRKASQTIATTSGPSSTVSGSSGSRKTRRGRRVETYAEDSTEDDEGRDEVETVEDGDEEDADGQDGDETIRENSLEITPRGTTRRRSRKAKSVRSSRRSRKPESYESRSSDYGDEEEGNDEVEEASDGDSEVGAVDEEQEVVVSDGDGDGEDAEDGGDDASDGDVTIVDAGEESEVVVEGGRRLRNGKVVFTEDLEDMDEDEQEETEEAEEEEEEEEESAEIDGSEEDDEGEDVEGGVDLAAVTENGLMRLRRDILVQLCEKHELEPAGTKKDLVRTLLEWRETNVDNDDDDDDGSEYKPESQRSDASPAPPSDATVRARNETLTAALRDVDDSVPSKGDEPLLLRPSSQRHSSPAKPETPPEGEEENPETELNELDLESLNLQDKKITTERLKRGEKIGSGGFKDVYQGHYGRVKVAIADIRGHLTENDIKELSLLRDLRHENIVRFIGVCVPDEPKDCPCTIVMELCMNGDLFDYIRNVPPKPADKAFSIMLDIANGLDYLHTRTPAIIHRDCKSSNVLITARGGAKISDFGLARVKKSTQSMIRSLVGTVNWQAPELWVPHPRYNEKVDVYSAALVFWEVLQWHAPVKKYPFEGQNEHSIYQDVGKKRLRPPTAGLRRQWSDGIVNLVDEMWSQEPHQRPTMTQVVDRLEDLIAEERSKARSA